MAKQMSRALGMLIVGAVALTGCSFNFGQQESSEPLINPNAKAYELNDLQHNSGDHSSPDALVYLAPEFLPGLPVHLIIYNHGMMHNVNQVAEIWELKKHMNSAAPNTVMIVPEWATNPSQLSTEGGRFYDPGFFKDMLAEIFSKTPELKDLTMDDVSEITITSYSGGWRATAAELYDNGLEDKVKTITFFDSLYKGNILDPWLKKNITALAKGDKHYYNFYFHTWPASRQQLNRIQKMIAEAGIKDVKMLRDLEDGQSVTKPERIARNGIVFKQSTLYDDQFSGHMNVPRVYFPQVVKALAIDEGELESTELAGDTAQERNY